MVPEERLELSRGYPHRILSPARLPFHHSGTRKNAGEILITDSGLGCKRPFKVQPSSEGSNGSSRSKGELLNLELLSGARSALEDQLPALAERSDAGQLRMLDVFQLRAVA